MEITKKEGEILNFIKKYKYCNIEHIREFVDKTKAMQKRIDHLIWQKEIEIHENFITIKSEVNINTEEKNNMLKLLDIATELKKQDRIIEIEMIDEPYYIAARTTANQYIYFTIVNKGKELIQLRLIDNENRGRTILVLEDSSQIEYLKILTTKVSKIIIYEEFLVNKKI